MPPDDPNSHTASIEVGVPANRAFEFMADGSEQTHWALGSWNRRQLDDGIFVGRSLFDGSELYVKPVGTPEHLLVDYWVGPTPGDLKRRVEARVMPGEQLGRGAGCSVITLTVWRGTRDTPESWARTYHAFKTEVHLIKGRLEAIA